MPFDDNPPGAHGGADCDDADPAVYVGAVDDPYDGLITDCSNADEYDAHADCDGADTTTNADDTGGAEAKSGCGCSGGPEDPALGWLGWVPMVALWRRPR